MKRDNVGKRSNGKSVAYDNTVFVNPKTNQQSRKQVCSRSQPETHLLCLQEQNPSYTKARRLFYFILWYTSELMSIVFKNERLQAVFKNLFKILNVKSTWTVFFFIELPPNYKS